MEKSNYDKELNRLIDEANKLTEKSELDLDTIKFLDNEALKLEEIIDGSTSTREQVEEAKPKLEMLYNRIEREMNESMVHDEKHNKIEKELKALRHQMRG